MERPQQEPVDKINIEYSLRTSPLLSSCFLSSSSFIIFLARFLLSLPILLHVSLQRTLVVVILLLPKPPCQVLHKYNYMQLSFEYTQEDLLSKAGKVQRLLVHFTQSATIGTGKIRL